MESSWRFNVAEKGMSLSNWLLCARLLGPPVPGWLLVKTSISKAQFWLQPLPPGALPIYTGIQFTITPSMRFPYGFDVEPD